MDARIDDGNWEHIFSAEGYASHPADVRLRQATDAKYTRDDVAEVIALVDGDNDGPDWVGVFRMNDGKFVVVRAGCDYTGWGCQEGGSSDVADTLADLIAFGLTTEERERLRDQLP